MRLFTAAPFSYQLKNQFYRLCELKFESTEGFTRIIFYSFDTSPLCGNQIPTIWLRGLIYEACFLDKLAINHSLESNSHNWLLSANFLLGSDSWFFMQMKKVIYSVSIANCFRTIYILNKKFQLFFYTRKIFFI